MFGFANVYKAMFLDKPLALWHSAEVDTSALSKIMEMTIEKTGEMIK
jgi:hypothetical protein